MFLMKKIALLGMVLTSVSCSNERILPQTLSKDTAASVVTEKHNIEHWPVLDIAVKKQPEIEARVQLILSGMTLEQKIAQMTQPEIRDVTVEEMRQYGFGSYLNGGGAYPNDDKHATAQDWVDLAEKMYQASIDDSLDGSTIPTMWGTDAVHGHNNVIGATLFPHNIGLGAANNPALIRQIASATASEVLVTGIDWIFAPTVAVVRDDRWGRTYEGYSEDPDIVREYAAAIVEGLQQKAGDGFLDEKHVIATVKHFIGDGGTLNGVDQGNNTDNEQHLVDIHAQGYVGGLSAGAQTVMASFNSWNGNKLHGSKYLLTDVLKDRMGFDGLVVGDWLGHGQVKGCTNENCPQAINAGLDIFMASTQAWKKLMQNTLAQVRSGEIPMARIDDAVSRILRVKLRAGLFDKPSPANRKLAAKANILGSDEHRAIARQAVRESLVLLKNKNAILPLKPNQRILVAGDGADNIGKQSGGWTITWQGTGNSNDEFPNATSIYQGIKQSVEGAGGEIQLNEFGNFTTKPDVAIVVFGEEPYAEGAGDLKDLNFHIKDKRGLETLKKLKEQGIPTVSVFISGRPMWVNSELNASDAFVAAWLPGSEGSGVADVLLSDENGKVQYDFTGRLSYSWPINADQTAVNRNDADYAPLLPYGFGLSYQQDANKKMSALADNLSEDYVVRVVEDNTVTLFDRVVQPEWKMMVGTNGDLQEMTSSSLAIDGLSIRTIDKDVQEDARSIVLNAKAQTVLAYSTKEQSLLQSIKTPSAQIDMLVKIDQRPSDAVMLSVCDEVDCLVLDVSDNIKHLPMRQWQKLSISLCNAQVSELSDATSMAVAFSSKGEMKWSTSTISVSPSEHECQN